MNAESFTTRAEIWPWTTDKASASWHFLTIKGDVADAIRLSALMAHGRRRGFGSVKVTATIGQTSWQTSLFPHKASDGWLLPVKAAVRKAEAVGVGDTVEVTVAI